MLIVSSRLADQGGAYAWAKELQVATRNCNVESLTAVNKGASACWIQLWNLPFGPAEDRDITFPISDTQATLVNHGFQFGDRAIVTCDTDNSGDKFVRPIDKDRFSLHDSLADALSNTNAYIFGDPSFLEGNSFITWQTTSVIPDEGSRAVVPEEYPLPASPNGVLSFTNARFSRGLYVRAVTAADGSTLISGYDIKFTPRYTLGPLS